MNRLIKAFGYSFNGLKAAIISETAFRQELMLAFILIPVVILLELSTIEKALMISSIILIIMVELVNTAIEAVVDRISEEKHSLSKKAKDVGSSVVLLAFLNAVCVWGIILLG